MERLPFSWRSGSLSFVSPENHQQQPSVRPLTTATNPPTSSSRFTFLPSSRSKKMAKFLSITLTILIITLVVGLVVSDTASNSQPGRSRLRAKSLSLRKKKLAAARLEETSTSSSIDESGAQVAPEVAEGNPEDITSSTTTTKPRSKKVAKSVHQRPPPDGNVQLPEGCGECDMTTCKSYTDKSCQAGMVMDRCSCCHICGSGEGNRCYNASIPNLPYTTDVGMCGTGLACILRKDLDPNEPKEALCECRDRRLVCGTDNHTYSNECKLREAAYKSPGLSIALWGPCVSAPWIPTAIENITVAHGEDASLSCEVKGFPSPIIHWEFLVHGSNGAPSILPGDDSSVVVTVRGGPEQTMSTSWIQIISVTEERQGTYYCVATNSHGVARNYATVSISRDRQQDPADNGPRRLRS